MENKYVYWHTGKAFLAGCVLVPIAACGAGAILIWFPDSWWSYTIGALSIAAFVWAPFAIDRRELMLRKR